MYIHIDRYKCERTDVHTYRHYSLHPRALCTHRYTVVHMWLYVCIYVHIHVYMHAYLYILKTAGTTMRYNKCPSSHTAPSSNPSPPLPTAQVLPVLRVQQADSSTELKHIVLHRLCETNRACDHSMRCSLCAVARKREARRTREETGVCKGRLVAA